MPRKGHSLLRSRRILIAISKEYSKDKKFLIACNYTVKSKVDHSKIVKNSLFSYIIKESIL